MTKNGPKGIPWVTIIRGGRTYRIYSDEQRTKYTIYELVNGSYVKLGAGSDPKTLENKYVFAA